MSTQDPSDRSGPSRTKSGGESRQQVTNVSSVKAFRDPRKKAMMVEKQIPPADCIVFLRLLAFLEEWVVRHPSQSKQVLTEINTSIDKLRDCFDHRFGKNLLDVAKTVVRKIPIELSGGLKQASTFRQLVKTILGVIPWDKLQAGCLCLTEGERAQPDDDDELADEPEVKQGDLSLGCRPTYSVDHILNDQPIEEFAEKHDCLLFFNEIFKSSQQHFYRDVSEKGQGKYLIKDHTGQTIDSKECELFVERELGLRSQDLPKRFPELYDSKKNDMGCKRWRHLFLFHEHDAIVLLNADGSELQSNSPKGGRMVEKRGKTVILQKLEDVVHAAVAPILSDKNELKKLGRERKQVEKWSAEHTEEGGSGVLEAPFSVPNVVDLLNLPKQKLWRKSAWNLYVNGRGNSAVCHELKEKVGNMVVNGITNVPSLFNQLKDGLKLKNLKGSTVLDKVAGIDALLLAWPGLINLPAALHRNDKRLHCYASIQWHHPLGQLYRAHMEVLFNRYGVTGNIGDEDPKPPGKASRRSSAQHRNSGATGETGDLSMDSLQPLSSNENEEEGSYSGLQSGAVSGTGTPMTSQLQYFSDNSTASPRPTISMCRMIVSNLHEDTTDRQFYEFFGTYGRVLSAVRKPGMNFGWVTFAEPLAVPKVFAAQSLSLGGNPLTISCSAYQSKSDRSPSPVTDEERVVKRGDRFKSAISTKHFEQEDDEDDEQDVEETSRLSTFSNLSLISNTSNLNQKVARTASGGPQWRRHSALSASSSTELSASTDEETPPFSVNNSVNNARDKKPSRTRSAPSQSHKQRQQQNEQQQQQQNPSPSQNTSWRNNRERPEGGNSNNNSRKGGDRDRDRGGRGNQHSGREASASVTNTCNPNDPNNRNNRNRGRQKRESRDINADFVEDGESSLPKVEVSQPLQE